MYLRAERDCRCSRGGIGVQIEEIVCATGLRIALEELHVGDAGVEVVSTVTAVQVSVVCAGEYIELELVVVSVLGSGLNGICPGLDFSSVPGVGDGDPGCACCLCLIGSGFKNGSPVICGDG